MQNEYLLIDILEIKITKSEATEKKRTTLITQFSVSHCVNKKKGRFDANQSVNRDARKRNDWWGFD